MQFPRTPLVRMPARGPPLEKEVKNAELVEHRSSSSCSAPVKKKSHAHNFSMVLFLLGAGARLALSQPQHPGRAADPTVCQGTLLTKRGETTAVLAWQGRAWQSRAWGPGGTPGASGARPGGGRAFGQTAWLPGVQVCAKKYKKLPAESRTFC